MSNQNQKEGPLSFSAYKLQVSNIFKNKLLLLTVSCSVLSKAQKTAPSRADLNTVTLAEWRSPLTVDCSALPPSASHVAFASPF
jgi:hypothetical protein